MAKAVNPNPLTLWSSANSRDPILQYLLLLPIPRFAEEDKLIAGYSGLLELG